MVVLTARVRLAAAAWLLFSAGVVAAAPPAPENDGVFQGFTIDATLLAGLPSGREAWSLLRTMEPTVVADRIEAGGLHLAAPALLGVHGVSWTETRLSLGEIDITDPDRGGTPLVAVPAEALTAVTLTTALGGGPPHVALVPAEPAETWHRRATLAVTPFVAPEGRGVAPSVARLGAWTDASLVASGPARPDLRVFTAARTTRATRTERGDLTRELDSRLGALLGQVVYKPGELEWRVLAAGSAAERPFAGRARRLDGEASENETGLHLQSSLSRPGAASPWSITGAYQYDRRTPGAGAAGEIATVERLRDGPVLEMYAPQRGVRRWDLVTRVSPRWLRLGDRNRPDLRLALERSHVAWRPVDGATTGATAERVHAAGARLWEVEASGPGPSGRITHLELGVSDRLTLHRTFIVEAGLGLDRWSAFREATPGRIEWKTVSPRAAARWRPVSFASLYGGWERFHPRLHASYLLWGDTAASSARVYRWDDDGDLAFEPAERGPLVALAGPAGPASVLDPELRSPRTQGIVAGLDLGPVAGWRVRFAGVRRTARDLVESVQTGLTAADYSVQFVADPSIDIVGPDDDRPLAIYSRRPSSFGRDRYLLTNAPGHEVVHENVELFFEGRPAGNLFFRVGGTASRTTGAGGNHGYGVLENDPGVIGEVFDSPNADTYASGRMFFDRAYTLKLAGLWRPGGWSFGLVAQYQDGQPFARVVLARGLPQGAEGIPAIRRSEHRFTYTMTVDARAERSFSLAGTRAAVVAEVFNLPDMKNEVEEDVVHGPSFRAVTAVQPPRAVRLGLRVDF